MATKNRCFSTVKALKRLDPATLSDVLRKFPDHLSRYDIELPAQADIKSMPYDSIQQACMADSGIPQELDDVLFFACLLGTTPGWEKIQAEARMQGLSLDFPVDHLTTADRAMRAWLHDWPNNCQLLEHSYARAKMHSRSSFVYYAAAHDVRDKYQAPSEAALADLRDRLTEYFFTQGMGRGTSVMQYDFQKEIWFLVRYPGHPRRYPAISDSGEVVSHVFKPEEYDAIVYHKEFGYLRLNTNRNREHSHYRIEFADLLLGEHNLFMPKYNMVTLDPLLGNSAPLFRCGDIPGIKDIFPVAVTYTSESTPGLLMTMKADSGSHLLYYDVAKQNLMEDPEANTVLKATFRYRLVNRSRPATITLIPGQTMTYERDGDSADLEYWLRSRDFLINPLEQAQHATQAAATT